MNSNNVFKVYINRQWVNLPAIGGPTVSGIEQRPRIHPMACAAPFWPTKSNAIGPITLTKHPSATPINNVIPTNKGNIGTMIMSIVIRPITNRDT